MAEIGGVGHFRDDRVWGHGVGKPLVCTRNPTHLPSLSLLCAEDRSSESIIEQLPICLSQATEVINIIAPAMSTLKHLRLDLSEFTGSIMNDKSHKLEVSGRVSAFCREWSRCMPLLERIDLYGSCVDIVIDAFGPACPKLETVGVRALISALGPNRSTHKAYKNSAHIEVSAPSLMGQQRWEEVARGVQELLEQQCHSPDHTFTSVEIILGFYQSGVRSDCIFVHNFEVREQPLAPEFMFRSKQRNEDWEDLDHVWPRYQGRSLALVLCKASCELTGGVTIDQGVSSLNKYLCTTM